jgi:argininosuccinate lyase
MDECPLGAGALAGTTYPIDREMTARELGFARVTANALDSVSDRDFIAETLSALSLIMVHLSRMSEEIVLWTGMEFGFAALDDAFGAGSSIMPQKKNPFAAELTRGKTGRVAGALMSVLMMMKGQPLAYNNDMQEDKEAVFDALDTVDMCLSIFPPMLRTLTFHPEVMARAAAFGYLNATDAADYLVRKGMAFRDAYTLVGKLVAHCTSENITLEELELPYLKAASALFDADFYDAVKLSACVEARNVPGGPAPEAVRAHIARAESEISGNENRK